MVMQTPSRSEDQSVGLPLDTGEAGNVQVKVNVGLPPEVLNPSLVPSHHATRSRDSASICIAASGLLFCFLRDAFPALFTPIVVLVVVLLVIIGFSGRAWWKSTHHKPETAVQVGQPSNTGRTITLQ